jgi:FkbM family methyltransferase
MEHRADPGQSLMRIPKVTSIFRRAGAAPTQPTPGRTESSATGTFEPTLDPAITPFYKVSATCQISNLALLHELVFGQAREGTFVEVGAYDGIAYSNTSCLAEAGWRGLYVEPVPAYAALCKANYEAYERVSVANLAIGRADGDLQLRIGDYFTTSSDEQYLEYQETEWGREAFSAGEMVTVPMTTLDRFLSASAISPGFDLLVVDVEGNEVDVFSAFDLPYWRPTAMIVELKDTAPESSIHRRTHAILSRDIQAHGYEILFKDAINTYFVRRDTRSLG